MNGFSHGLNIDKKNNELILFMTIYIDYNSQYYITMVI